MDCCEDIATSCEKMCEECFKEHLENIEEEDSLEVLSLIVDWNEGIDLLLNRFKINIDASNIFEKVCMNGDELCVKKILKGSFIDESTLRLSLILSKKEISKIIQDHIDCNDDLLMIKQPCDYVC